MTDHKATAKPEARRAILKPPAFQAEHTLSTEPEESPLISNETFAHLALSLAIQKLQWALQNPLDASNDALVKIAMTKGLDQKNADPLAEDPRVEIILTAPEIKPPHHP